MPNKLIHETSPYLLQHANNPVEWYPWGNEALQKARSENKPIFLSIGYAACHWCHVMEHESFEDPETAQLLNEHFVSIKVDREERPDLDGIYMSAVVAMTGQGGWPMSVFLTPEGAPFYSGTYFPSTRRYNMPAFREVLSAIAQSWQNDIGEIQKVSQDITTFLNEQALNGKGTAEPLRPDFVEQAARQLVQTHDWKMGGWGSAPRFPQAMAIDFLLMQSTRGVEKSLEAANHVLGVMNRGGLYDVVGGGFHRYSTDDAWLVPHFEKMLYDNGQLALAYLHAYLLTGSTAFRQTCTETLDFLVRDMRHLQGGFYSSLDADSEGEEGKYYLWAEQEILASLPDPADRELLNKTYPITAHGNFEGQNILQRKSDIDVLAAQAGLSEAEYIQQMTAIHKQLYIARERRVRPQTDDKVLTAWNALALRAFAQAARYLDRRDYLEIARSNANFILQNLYRDGRLLRAWRGGQARHNAFLEDYAGLVLALLDLYQSDPNPLWFSAARELGEKMIASFTDPQGGFFDTPSEQEQLIVRPKEIQDNATPSGNAQAALALLQLAAYDENTAWSDLAEKSISTVQNFYTQHPTAFGFWLQAADFALGPVQQVAVVASINNEASAQPMLHEIWSAFRPRMVVAATTDPDAQRPGLLKGRGTLRGAPTVYVCQGFVCKLPVNTVEGLREQLG